ncbi:MAG: preprotein translocase subunit SecG [Candidatus Cloacimonadaceae bacterium]
MILYTVMLVVHIMICIALVLVILSQTSKGGLDATLGGAAMNVFGGSGASTFLKRWTQYLGVAFVISCLVMAFLVKNLRTSSRATDLQKRINTEAPVQK